jgi:hypothetical protein
MRVNATNMALVRLGEVALNEAYDAGSAMGDEEVIAFALAV